MLSPIDVEPGWIPYTAYGADWAGLVHTQRPCCGEAPTQHLNKHSHFQKHPRRPPLNIDHATPSYLAKHQSSVEGSLFLGEVLGVL